MTTTTLRLRACPRCDGAMKASYDEYGAFWDCTRCGHHTYGGVPPAPRIRRPEAIRAYYSVFDYRGPNEALKGLRIRARLLPPRKNEKTPRFDLLCPYPGCQWRQRRQGTNANIYRCMNAHPVRLDLDELTWA